MTKLVDEILNQIDAYEMEQIVAEEAVIKAHMEATMRDIEIRIECERAGIIMESDEWDGKIIPTRNDENIFKYILLFIPRLIINFCKKIWSFFKKAGDEIVEKAKAEGEQEVNAELMNNINLICNLVTQKTGTKFGYTDGVFFFLGKSKKLGECEGIYETFQNTFTKYEEIFSSFVESDKLSERAKTDEMFIQHARAALKTTELFSKNDDVMIPETGFKEGYKRIRGAVQIISKNVTDAMERVIDHYHEILDNEKIFEGNKKLAQDFIHTIEDYYSDFIAFDSSLRADLERGLNCFRLKNFYVKKFRETTLGSALEDSVETHEKLKEKLNDWGVK